MSVNITKRMDYGFLLKGKEILLDETGLGKYYFI